MPAFVIVGGLAAASVVGVIRTSLRPGLAGSGGFGLAAWRTVFADPAFGDALRFTLWVAVASTLIAVIVAVPTALALRRGPLAGRLALGLPVAAPHLVVAALAGLWLAPGGLAERLIGDLPFTITGDRRGVGIILVYAWKDVPFLVLVALSALDRSTQELEDSAAALGAGPWHRLRDVIAARLAVPLIGGGMLIAAFVIGAVEVPLVVGPTRPDMLGTYALDAVRIDGPAARADAAVAHVVAAGLVAVVGVALIMITRRRSAQR